MIAALMTIAALQDPAALLERGRGQIDQLNADSAVALIQRAVSSGIAGPTRVRAFTLLAISELIRDNRLAARRAFEQALRLDNSLRIDSLADLHSDARVVFGEARTAVVPEIRVLLVAVSVPDSSLIVPGESSLAVELRPTGRARVVTTIAPLETPLDVIWSDTQSVDIAAVARWDLAGRQGGLAPDGRYVLRVTATDAGGQVAPSVERYLALSRVPVDTQPAPPPLDSGRLLPESYRVARAGSGRLIFSGLLAGGTLALPLLFGSGELGGGTRAVIAAGAISVAGLLGFFRGSRTFPIPENVAHNQQLREQDASLRGAIAASNARLAAAAPVVVRVEAAAR